MRAFRYSLDEALTSLWRGRSSGLLSTGTIAVALFVLGAFLLLTSNLERAADELSRSAEMSIYLSDDATPADQRAIESMLAPGSVVAGFQYVSKADAVNRFKSTFADLAPTIDTLGSNPLPASYEVRLQPAPGAQDAAAALAARMQETPGVADVRFDRQWLDRLMSMVTGVRRAGLVLGGILTLAAALTVANVVRLALYARRDEIEIMQLVGAPQTFIRGPFVMEGVLQGGIGAAVSLAALAAAFLVARAAYLAPLAGALNLSSVGFLPPLLCVALVLGGMAVGCVGGLVAAAGRT
jgi:cell division transport system permease protein